MPLAVAVQRGEAILECLRRPGRLAARLAGIARRLARDRALGVVLVQRELLELARVVQHDARPLDVADADAPMALELVADGDDEVLAGLLVLDRRAGSLGTAGRRRPEQSERQLRCLELLGLLDLDGVGDLDLARELGAEEVAIEDRLGRGGGNRRLGRRARALVLDRRRLDRLTADLGHHVRDEIAARHQQQTVQCLDQPGTHPAPRSPRRATRSREHRARPPHHGDASPRPDAIRATPILAAARSVREAAQYSRSPPPSPFQTIGISGGYWRSFITTAGAFRGRAVCSRWTPGPNRGFLATPAPRSGRSSVGKSPRMLRLGPRGNSSGPD